MKRVLVVINRRSLKLLRADESACRRHVVERFARHGVEAEVWMGPGREVAASARRALQDGFDALVAGGGDGTVSATAGVIAGTETPLGVLPMGTLNHFAKDLKMPLMLEEAIDTIALNRVRRIDLASVNGRYYINTCLVGTYPELVAERDAVETRRRSGKWLAHVWAGLKVARRWPRVRVWLDLDGERLYRHTSLVFVGNNAYCLRLLTETRRPALNGGVLSVFSPRRAELRHWGKLVWQAWRGHLWDSADFDSWIVSAATLQSTKGRLRVAVDGEVVHMKSPLRFRVHRGSLRVLAPEEGA